MEQVEECSHQVTEPPFHPPVSMPNYHSRLAYQLAVQVLEQLTILVPVDEVKPEGTAKRIPVPVSSEAT